MKQGIFKTTSNEKIARDIFKMTLAGDTSVITAPGQFVNIKLDGFFLRRPGIGLRLRRRKSDADI